MGTLLFDRKRFLTVLVSLLLLFLFLSLLLPAAGTAGAGAATKEPNPLVEKSVEVGSYGITVLRPTQLDGLNKWLADNGFSALPTGAEGTIADYISKGWVFAAIKLTRGESGLNAPHPIKMVFAAKEPIYPMTVVPSLVYGG